MASFQCLTKNLLQCNFLCLLTSEQFDFTRQALKKEPNLRGGGGGGGQRFLSKTGYRFYHFLS